MYSTKILPLNHGKPWTTTNVDCVKQLFINGTSIDNIAHTLGRTSGSIKSLISQTIWSEVDDGKTLQQLSSEYKKEEGVLRDIMGDPSKRPKRKIGSNERTKADPDESKRRKITDTPSEIKELENENKILQLKIINMKLKKELSDLENVLGNGQMTPDLLQLTGDNLVVDDIATSRTFE